MSRTSSLSKMVARWGALLAVLALLGNSCFAQKNISPNGIGKVLQTNSFPNPIPRPRPRPTIPPGDGPVSPGGDEIDETGNPQDAADEGEEIVTVSLSETQWVVPIHDPADSDSGDAEFEGHGPKIAISAKIFLSNKTTVRTQLTMTAHETCPDSSFGVGKSSRMVVYTAPAGYEVVGVYGFDDRLPIVQYTDTDHAADVFSTQFGQVTSYGDGIGADLANDDSTPSNNTRAKLDWDYELTVKIKPIDNSYLLAGISLFDTQRNGSRGMVIGNTNGDNEFDGNGPRMTVFGGISYTANYVDIELVATAKETGGDRSEGNTYWGQTVYQAPPGFRIVELRDGHGRPHGNRAFGTLVDFTDYDHHPNFIHAGEIGLFRMFGDHEGDDLGGYNTGYTRAQLHGVNYHMVVVLEPE